MAEYFTDNETVVGHKLIFEQKGLRKKLHLQDVTYGGLMWDILLELNEIDTETIYEDIRFALKTKIEENTIRNISFRSGGEGIGNSETEKRINALQFQFADAYLKKELKLFESGLNY